MSEVFKYLNEYARKMGHKDFLTALQETALTLPLVGPVSPAQGKALQEALARYPGLKEAARAVGIRKILPYIGKEEPWGVPTSRGFYYPPGMHVASRRSLPISLPRWTPEREQFYLRLMRGARARAGETTRPVVALRVAKKGTPRAAEVLAHEIGHQVQKALGQPSSDEQAEMFGQMVLELLRRGHKLDFLIKP